MKVKYLAKIKINKTKILKDDDNDDDDDNNHHHGRIIPVDNFNITIPNITKKKVPHPYLSGILTLFFQLHFNIGGQYNRQ